MARLEQDTTADGTSGTVARVLHLLAFVAHSDGEFGIKDVAQGLALAPSTAHRLLGLLREGGFVTRSEVRRYRIGPQFLRLASMALEGNDLEAAALGPMQQVVDTCGETCLLAVYHEHSQTMSFVARVDSSNALRYRIRMHAVETIAWGATGRSILAFLPAAAIQQVLARGERSPGSGRRLVLAEARAELESIREKGYALSRSQRIEGAVGLSVPIFGAGKRVIGSLSVTAPEQRFRARDEARLANTLASASSAISRALGAEVSPA
jgi:DNA-binding IclR family transcriptional regulator